MPAFKTFKRKWLALVPAVVVAMAGCEGADNAARPSGDAERTETALPTASASVTISATVSVARIERYDKAELADWLDESTLLAVKDNEGLGRMELEELRESYPRSLYLFDTDTEQYKTLKEKKNTFLGGASLSPDKKFLIYSEFTLGDPVYYVMDMASLESHVLHGAEIGDVMSARWTPDNDIAGAAYSGNAYSANTAGEAKAIEGLKASSPVIVSRAGQIIYYNTSDDPTLMAFHLDDKQTASTHLNQVSQVLPAPDGRLLLVTQYNEDGSRMSLALADMDGGNRRQLAEGAEIGAVSWSPDQQLIAYRLTKEADGSASELYVYDLLQGETIRLATDLKPTATSWSPAGDKLAFSEWNEDQANSGIVYLNRASRK